MGLSNERYRGDREFSPKRRNDDGRENMAGVKNKPVHSDTRTNGKRKDVSPSGPLQAMMNRRQKRRV
jgi:hypothetical protein